MALSIISHFCLRTRADFEIMQRTSVKVNHSTARPSKVSLTLSWNDAGPSVSACILISRSCFAKLVPDGLAKRIQLYCLPKERCQTATMEVQGKWYRPCWLFNSKSVLKDFFLSLLQHNSTVKATALGLQKSYYCAHCVLARQWSHSVVWLK